MPYAVNGLLALSRGGRWLLDADRFAFAWVDAFPSGPNPKFPVVVKPGCLTTAAITKRPMNAASRKIATTSPRRRARHLAMSISTKPIGAPRREWGIAQPPMRGDPVLSGARGSHRFWRAESVRLIRSSMTGLLWNGSNLIAA